MRFRLDIDRWGFYTVISNNKYRNEVRGPMRTMGKKGKYIYDWPRPMVTVDAVVFGQVQFGDQFAQFLEHYGIEVVIIVCNYPVLIV